MNNKFNDLITSSLVVDPEKSFEQPELTHKTTEIYRFIDQFDAAREPKQVYQWVKQLLLATVNFRAATVPEGVMFELRNSGKPDEDLKETLQKMMDALNTAEKHESSTDENDERILNLAINYCKTSIKQRMSSLNPEDRLLPFWKDSALKKYIET